jgi:hypothetical protein
MTKLMKSSYPSDVSWSELSQFQRLVQAFEESVGGDGTVGPGARLANVRAQMDGSQNRSDVFVTENGTRNSKVLGLLKT